MINRTRYESNDLDKNQNEAARIVSGATKLASILSFQKRVGLCPDDLTSIVPATVVTRQHPLFRYSSDLQTSHKNSHPSYSSFSPSVLHY